MKEDSPGGIIPGITAGIIMGGNPGTIPGNIIGEAEASSGLGRLATGATSLTSST